MPSSGAILRGGGGWVEINTHSGEATQMFFLPLEKGSSLKVKTLLPWQQNLYF